MLVAFATSILNSLSMADAPATAGWPKDAGQTMIPAVAHHQCARAGRAQPVTSQPGKRIACTWQGDSRAGHAVPTAGDHRRPPAAGPHRPDDGAAGAAGAAQLRDLKVYARRLDMKFF